MILLFVACQVPDLWRIPTLKGDSTLYIQSAHTMIESGDWMTPRYESGAIRLQKPILTYWLVGGSMRLFGPGHGLAPMRLPSLLTALATLGFVFGLGQVLLKDRLAALLATAAHASTEVVYSNAHQARTDSILAFFVVGSMYFFARLIFEPGHERRDAILAYSAAAGALLTKGMAAFAFGLLPVAVFLAICWKRTGSVRWRAVASPWGLAAMVLIAGPWYGLTLAHHGRAFVSTFLFDQIGDNVAKPKWYLLANLLDYPWLLFRSCFPWGLVAVFGLVADDARVRRVVKERGAQWAFLLTWIGCLSFILMCSGSTRMRYTLPALPPVSLLAGLLLAQIARSAQRPKGVTWALHGLTLGAVLTGAGLLAHVAVQRVAGSGIDAIEVAAALVLIGCGVAMFMLNRRGLVAHAALCAGAWMVLLMASINAFLSPAAPLQIAAELVREVLVSQPQDVRLATAGLTKQVRTIVLVLSGRRVTEWTDSGERAEQMKFLRKLGSQAGRSLVLIDGKLYSALPDDVRQQWSVLGKRSGIRKLKLKRWLRKEPRTLKSLLDSNRITIYALYHEKFPRAVSEASFGGSAAAAPDRRQP